MPSTHDAETLKVLLRLTINTSRALHCLAGSLEEFEIDPTTINDPQGLAFNLPDAKRITTKWLENVDDLLRRAGVTIP